MRAGRTQRESRRLAAGAGITWLTALALGMFLLNRYQMTPGPASTAAPHWPGGSDIALASDRDALVMFLHPHCACSSASVEELNRLVARSPNVLIQVFMFQANDADNVTDTPLGQNVHMPGVVVKPIETVCWQRARLCTSGQAYLYNRSGRLLFDGGITGSRGHAGDNAGLDALLNRICRERESATDSTARTQRFGCPLNDTIPRRKVPTMFKSDNWRAIATRSAAPNTTAC